MLVVWREQSNCRPPLAGVPEVAKAAGHFAPEATRESSRSAEGETEQI